jgi:diguanylate cyclase (GGDEF)-like protein
MPRVQTRQGGRWPLTAAGMTLLMAIWAGWEAFHWPAGGRVLVGDFFFYPVGAVAIFTAWGASRRCQAQPRLRSAWRLLALASALYLAGDIAQTVYEASGPLPFPGVDDAFYLAYYPVALAGFLRFPSHAQSVGERVRLGLDLGIVAIGGAAVVIDVLLGPTIIQTYPDPLSCATSIAYPVGDMVLMVGLGAALLRRAAPSGRRALQLLAAGVAFFICADLVYGWIQLHSTYQGGDPVDGLWMVAIAIWAVAGSVQGAPEPAVDLGRPAPRRRPSWAPYLAVAVSFGLLAWEERADPLLPNGILIVAAMTCAGLVSIRQFLAQRDLVRTQGRLAHQSLHDSLTGLPNRELVIDRGEQMLARARRTGVPMAALYVDLDGFKQVNDSFGHAAGDELLRLVGSRVSGVIRDGDTVGRLAGDEFVVLLDGATLDVAPELVAQRICEVLAHPIELERAARVLTISASVGVALGEQGTVDELLRDADCALYEAKRAGGDRWSVFESGMQTAARERVELEMDLRDALAGAQFRLVYQPIVDLRTEAVTAAEALLRWEHPRRGPIAPGVFIPLAEARGEILAIGRWVLGAACAQAAQWHAAGHALGISVNVSTRQLEHPDFVADVAATLTRTGLEPGALTLEITETALMRHPDDAAAKLADLKALGVRIAVDDFGTGYSSLGYLLQFPVDELKIDRSFIAGISASAGSDALVHTLVSLGETLGLQTLAEGIEETVQLECLRREGCQLGQGYLFARPLEADALTERLTGAGLGGAVLSVE